MAQLSGYKGFNFPLKGIVVDDNDPENLNRVQVRIPSYHGDKEFVDSDGKSTLPWAQMCSVTTKEDGFLGLLRGSSSSVIPEVDDVVWLLFEGGDIRSPVVIGTMPKDVDYSNKDENMGGDGDSYECNGGSLIDLAREIIMKEEGTYDTVVDNDNGAISIGMIQWHAGAAKSLLQAIQKENNDNFKKLAGSSGLISAMSRSWSNYVPTSSISKAIKEILKTEESKKVQNARANSYISTYMKHGKELGITNADALIYYADLENQFGCGEAPNKVRKTTKPYTLDKIHKVQVWYVPRRNRVYNAIKKLISDGKLIKKDNTVVFNDNTINTGGKLLGYPTKSRTISAGYPNYSSGRYHGGIDFPVATGSDVYASEAGTVYIRKELTYSYGKYIVLKHKINGTTYYTLYAHNSKLLVNNGDTVKRGQLIAKSGSTGNSTGPHCHFAVYKNTYSYHSSEVNPLSMLK